MAAKKRMVPKNPKAMPAPRAKARTEASRARGARQGGTDARPRLNAQGKPSKRGTMTNFGATKVGGAKPTPVRGNSTFDKASVKNPVRFNNGVKRGMTDEQKKVAGKELEKMAAKGYDPRYAAARARQLATGEGAAG